MNVIEAPDAQLIYSKSIEVLGGIKEIQLYWGDLASIVCAQSSVLVSSNVHNEKRDFLDNGLEPHPIGQAWSSIQKKFGLNDDQRFQSVLEASAGSGVWATSQTMERALNVYGPEFRRLIRIDCLKPESVSSDAPKNIFCLHTLPFHQSRSNPETELDDYTNTLGACFAAIRAQEASDFITGKESEPYSELVMSALAAQQFDRPHSLLRHLMETVENWFLVSPKLKVIKVCYWDKKIHQRLMRQVGLSSNGFDSPSIGGRLRQDLLDEIGEPAIRKSELEATSTKLLVEEFSFQLCEFKELELVKHEAELVTAIDNMLVVLHRENPTTLEIGSSSGRLAEGLVNHLCNCFYGRRPSTFHGGIEDLASKPPSTEGYRGLKISAWYKSYLHTLRILRNTAAHSQDEPENQFPSKLAPEDTWVLLVNLRRVVGLHGQLITLEL